MAGALSPDLAFLATTYLFVPGDRPERFTKAVESGADAVILDLEDAVAPPAKATARANIASWLATASPPVPVLVRVNALGSADSAADIAALASWPAPRLMVAKSEEPGALAALADALPRAMLLPLVESAKGIADAQHIASIARVGRLAFGALDYCADLGIDGDPRALIHPMSCLALASRRADLPPPIASPTAALDDAPRLRDDVELARALGFTAKLCIHPRQVAGVAAAFAPTPAEIAWAERIVAAGAGAGAMALDGQMVDAPVRVRAQSILRRVRR
ncbi:MAG: CoA ester lyase [Proteobacteria bacterium]|nr:CoA ester lyase [Pseudomonadota bacterium]